MTCMREVSVGAYILGILEPAEREEMGRHLATCAICRSARDEFAALPGLLSRVTAQEVETATEPPGELAFRRLSAAADQARRLRRNRSVLGAAAAVLLVLLAGLTVAAWPDGARPPTTVSASHGPVHARVTIQAADTGSQLTLQLRGVPSGQRCRLVVVGADGQREVAGSWTATYAGTAEVKGWSGLAPSDVHRVVVETPQGRDLVDFPLS
jgi:anti-sigma factor RsiW